MKYLRQRGFKSHELFKNIKVGFANGSLLKTLSKELKQQLKEIGILTSTGRERFLECVVFPLFDQRGNIFNLYGRHVSKDGHYYLPGGLRGLFYPPKATDQIILTEGVIDALTLLNAGYQNALAIYGVNGLTEDPLSFFQQQRIQRVTLCLDGDETGSKAIPKLSKRLTELGLDVFSVALPEGLDINDYFLKHSKGEFDKLLKSSIDNRQSTIDFGGGDGWQSSIESIEGGFLITFPERAYRVLGMNLHGLDRLKVNIKAQQGKSFHIDSLDLFHHRAREHFVKASARLLSAGEPDLTREVNQLIDLLEEKRLELLEGEPKETDTPEMTEAERKEAIKSLKSKALLKQILTDFDRCGCIGEETAKLFGYLATISRFQENPLGILIVSRSGAGKSLLQEAICSFVPPEDLQAYTRITGQKKTEKYLVEGPVVIIITTTNPEALDFETRNRFVILTIDESREQTQRILQRQREKDSLEGLIRSQSEQHILHKHHNAQRLLKPLNVVNPFHKELTYPDDKLLMRRDHQKYLTLIKSLAFLHQYQRGIKTVQTSDGEVLESIEVTVKDIEIANKLACDILGRSLDELSPHTRSLPDEIKKFIDDLEKKPSRATQPTCASSSIFF